MTASIPRLFQTFVAALAILLAGAVHSRAIVVIGNSFDMTGANYGGQLNQIQFVPLGTPQTIGTNVYWPKTAYAAVTNSFFTTPLIQGFYNASPVNVSTFGPRPKSILIYASDSTSNVWRFTDCANIACLLQSYISTNGFGGVVLTNDARALVLTNPANQFAGTFTGTHVDTNGQPLIATNFVWQGSSGANLYDPLLSGEIGLENNPTNVISVASAVDSYNSSYGTYTVFSAINPVTDHGPGFFSGENFQVFSTSGLQFGVWYSTNANAPFNQWNYFPAAPVEHSNGNGTSTYGITLTQTNSTYYIFRQLSGPPTFVNTLQAAAGANLVSLGFTPDGNYADVNLTYNGVVIAKWMAQGGVSLNNTNGNNFLAGWSYGVTIGDGHGGNSGAFLGTNGFANFTGIITNSTTIWYGGYKTNGNPSFIHPPPGYSAHCDTTNYQSFTWSNNVAGGVWLLK